MIVKAIREGLGRLIVLGDYLSRPAVVERSEQAQADVNAKISQMSIYQFYACPFCIKTRRAIRRLNLPMEYRDAQSEGQHREDLEQLGGKIKVPCLRIQTAQEERWLYESNDIIAYLDAQFKPAEPSQQAC
jgi:glutaredoxin